jgi:hypothetical protein
MLNEPSTTQLEIYDMLGLRVTMLVGGTQQAGYYAVSWNASGADSGVFLSRPTGQGSDC